MHAAKGYHLLALLDGLLSAIYCRAVYGSTAAAGIASITATESTNSNVSAMTTETAYSWNGTVRGTAIMLAIIRLDLASYAGAIAITPAKAADTKTAHKTAATTTARCLFTTLRIPHNTSSILQRMCSIATTIAATAVVCFNSTTSMPNLACAVLWLQTIVSIVAALSCQPEHCGVHVRQ